MPLPPFSSSFCSRGPEFPLPGDHLPPAPSGRGGMTPPHAGGKPDWPHAMCRSSSQGQLLPDWWGRHVAWTVCGAQGFCWVCWELDVTLGAPGTHPAFRRENLPKTQLVLRKEGRETENEKSHPDYIIWASGLSFASKQPYPWMFYELINKLFKKNPV